VGKEVPVKLLRDGKELTLKVKIAERKDGETAAAESGPDPADLGIRAQDLTPEIARRLGVDENEKGALIAAVQPGSKADQAGLRQGDIVKEVNRTPVQTAADLRSQIGKAKTGEAVQLLVKRGSAGFVVVKITK
jgi:serine protease Do